MSDVLAGSRRFRVLAVVDDYTAECLCLVADTSLSGLRVARELDTVIASRKSPAMIVSDNGTEFTSMAILLWSQERLVEWRYIAPGKPQQNAFKSIWPTIPSHRIHSSCPCCETGPALCFGGRCDFPLIFMTEVRTSFASPGRSLDRALE